MFIHVHVYHLHSIIISLYVFIVSCGVLHDAVYASSPPFREAAEHGSDYLDEYNTIAFP